MGNFGKTKMCRKSAFSFSYMKVVHDVIPEAGAAGEEEDVLSEAQASDMS